MKVITDWNAAPYEQYLLVIVDGQATAYPIADDEPLDIDEQLRKAFPGRDYRLYPDGPMHAMIITDGRPANTSIVWQSRYFYAEYKDE